MLNKKERIIMRDIENQILDCKKISPNMFNIYLKEIEKELKKLKEIQPTLRYRIKITDKRDK